MFANTENEANLPLPTDFKRLKAFGSKVNFPDPWAGALP